MKPTVEQLKKRIFDSCTDPECGDDKPGYRLVKSSGKVVIEDCRCMVQYKRQMRYVTAGVPGLFWEFDLRELIPAFKRNNTESLGAFRIWLEELDAAIHDGASLLLWSVDHGTAKSAMASIAIRRALDKQYNCLWFAGTRLFDEFLRDSRRDRSELGALIDQSQLVVIDEVDKIYIPGGDDPRLTRSMAIDFFNRLYEQRISVIGTSQLAVESLRENYPEAIVDRMLGWDEVQWEGVKYRKRTPRWLDQVIEKKARSGKN